VLIMKQTLWKKISTLLKNILKTYVNFTIIVIIVAEKKNRHYIFTEVHVPTKILEQCEKKLQLKSSFHTFPYTFSKIKNHCNSLDSHSAIKSFLSIDHSGL